MDKISVFEMQVPTTICIWRLGANLSVPTSVHLSSTSARRMFFEGPLISWNDCNVECLMMLGLLFLGLMGVVWLTKVMHVWKTFTDLSKGSSMNTFEKQTAPEQTSRRTWIHGKVGG